MKMLYSKTKNWLIACALIKFGMNSFLFCLIIMGFPAVKNYAARNISGNDYRSYSVWEEQTNPWQAFYPGRAATYTDTNNYHSFAVADSVKEVNDTVLVWFRAFLRSTEVVDFCAFKKDLAIPGAKMIIHENGVNLLVNQFNDTITIKTLAKPDDEWIAWQNNELVIKARIVQKTKALVLGITDSIKHIQFNTFDHTLVETNHPFSGLQLQLSKSFGFITSVNFNNFPHQDEIFSMIGCTNPNLGIVNLTWFDVFGFDPGDEIHVLTVDKSSFFEHYHYEVEMEAWRFLSRRNYPDSIVYEVKRKKLIETKQTYFDKSKFEYINDTIITVIHPWPEFDFMAGEEIVYDQSYSSLHEQMIEHNTSFLTKITNSLGIVHEPDYNCFQYVIYDGPSPYDFYYKGLGGPYYYTYWFFSTKARSLEYFRKGEITWGTPLDFTLSSGSMVGNKMAVFPNPAKGFVNIILETHQLPVILDVADISGKTVISQTLTNQANTIYVNELNPGIYFYRLISREAIMGSGKLIVQ